MHTTTIEFVNLKPFDRNNLFRVPVGPGQLE